MKKNIIIHIPHSSLRIPKMFWNNCLLTKEEILNENKFMCDLYVDKFISKNRFETIVFKYSRIFCDVERFNSDLLEPMNKKGMGIVYTKTSKNITFANVNDIYKEKVINEYYNKHHKLLNETTKKIIDKYNECLIVDLHSFSDELVYDIKKIKNNPDICIGFDKCFYNKNIVNFTKSFFEKHGYSTKFNYPYSGSMIPSNYYFNKDKSVKSIMIEINKRLYLDTNNKRNKNYKKLKKIIKIYLKNLCVY